MTLAGSDDYIAPEVIMGMDYDEKCDVFRYYSPLPLPLPVYTNLLY